MVALAMEDVEHAPPLMTLEEWADMEEDEPGEFVDGRVVEEEVPSNLHELVVAWLMRVVGVWAYTHRYVILGSEHKLGLSPMRGRKPDVCIYPPRTKLPPSSPLSRKPPLLIVEVISTQSRDVRRDRHEKRVEYARFGVRHYWLIDPASRLFEFLKLGADGYVTSQSAAEGRVEVAGFEGLVLDLDQLWADVDEVTASEEEGNADVEPSDDAP